MTGLKNAYNQRAHRGEEIDRILALPITSLRMELKDAFGKVDFDQKKYQSFITRLAATPYAELDDQLLLAAEALKNGGVASPRDLDLSTPAKQLLWAAVLTRIIDERTHSTAEDLPPVTLWQQLAETPRVRDELIRASRVIYSSMGNDDVRIAWGGPGSWFGYYPETNNINLDFYYTLLVGFEHSRAAALHEIGHSQLSTRFSPRMDELFNHVKKYRNAEGGLSFSEDISDEELKALGIAAKEWGMRHDLWNVMEDVTVNQFAADKDSQQNLADSMNHVGTMMQGWGELALGTTDVVDIRTHNPHGTTEEQRKKMEERRQKLEELLEIMRNPLPQEDLDSVNSGDISPDIAFKMVEEIKSAALLGFYLSNGLIDGSEASWHRLRVFPGDVSSTVHIEGVEDSFARLIELSAGANGVNKMKPTPKDKLFGKVAYKQKVEEATEARLRVMEYIWDTYIAKFAKVLLDESEREIQQAIDEKNNKEDSSNEQGDGDPQQGEGNGQSGHQQGEGGEPREGQSGDGNGTSQDSQGQSGGGQGQQKQQSQGSSGGGKNSIYDSILDAIRNMKNSPTDRSDGEQSDKKDKKKEDKSGWDSNKDKGEKVGDLRNKDIVDHNMSEEQRDELQKQADQRAGQNNSQSSGPDNRRDVDLKKLAKGDWRDFERRIAELSPIIDDVARKLVEIRNHQRKEILRMSKTHEFVPDDGDVRDRLDTGKVLDTKRRIASRQPLKDDDFKKFYEDLPATESATIEFYQMIDGSGSMTTLNLEGGSTAMEVALQSAVIMYMACRKAGIDAYIMMWGDADPLIIARPDSDYKDVGRALEALRNGRGTGTNLDPALKKAVREMAGYRSKTGTISGSSHIQIYSDGEIFDTPAALQSLQTMLREGVNMTIDAAVMRPENAKAEPAMEDMFNQAAQGARGKSSMIGIMHGDKAETIPRNLSRNLLGRVRTMEIKGEPDAKKRGRLAALYRKLTK